MTWETYFLPKNNYFVAKTILISFSINNLIIIR